MIASPLIAASASLAPATPRTAKNATGLVKAPWTLVSQALGDLNNDGRPDAAVVANFASEKLEEPISRLIVALQNKSGQLEVVAESDRATMASCGSSGGQPMVEIKKGILLVNHYCGSRERTELTHKYQLRNDKWLLIGFTAVNYDSTAPNNTQSVDINFVTGQVESNSSIGKNDHNERFLEVRAPKISSPEPSVTDWSVPRIVLRPLTGKAPAIATQAVYSDKKLFVRVQYDPPSNLTPYKVSLVTAGGKTIAPLNSEKSPYGYVLQTYDLTSQAMKQSQKTPEEAAESHKILRLNLEVQADAAAPARVSTARTSTGAILLSRSHEPLTLKEVDAANGPMPHPLMYSLPSN